MHISSLPSKEGIGTFGYEAFRFVDFLKKAGQTYWQILPLCPIGAGNSPYHSICCFAGNPLFIDIELLAEDDLLEDIPEFSNPWAYENYQRNYILDILKTQNCSDGDIIIVSDLDEIPSEIRSQIEFIPVSEVSKVFDEVIEGIKNR